MLHTHACVRTWMRAACVSVSMIDRSDNVISAFINSEFQKLYICTIERTIHYRNIAIVIFQKKVSELQM